ncbi:MAG: hypothetical protein IPO90_16245 [Flavobacteriales bacterium]|nr:hypothetical protein [Flavobacteriales bacterium]
MKYGYTLFSLIAACGPLVAQDLPTMWSADTVTMNCPWDSGETIQTFQGWEAYQTLNDEWNGPVDSTRCLDLFVVVNNSYVQPRIQFDQVDTTRSVFVRVLLDSSSAIPLDSSTIYTLQAGLYPSQNDLLDTSGSCPGALCTGVMAAVQVPDSAGMGSVLRWYTGSYDPFGGFGYPVELCVPTERFASNRLREVILRITSVGAAAGEFVNIDPPILQNMDQWSGVQKLRESVLPQFQTGQFDYFLQGFFGPSFLVMYEDSTYPDAAHQSYLDVSPIPNVAAPTNVTLNLDQYSTMVFQPFTQFRGGLIVGSDSLRHPFSFVNDGDLCMASQIVEVIWSPGSRYVHNGGHVDMDGERCCFLFRKGSTLRINNGVRFDYGAKRRGMLGLRAGCTIDIGANAELVINNMVDMKEDFGATEHQDIILALRDGAKLTFAPGARLFNGNSIGQATQLLVYLDGGSIDITGLPPEDRLKVRVIEVPPVDLGGTMVLGNVGGNRLLLHLASRIDGLALISIMDVGGRAVAQEEVPLVIGPNTVRIEIPTAAPGTYFLRAELEGTSRVERFVVE